MKLKCGKHNERAMVLPSKNVIHRNTGEKCDTIMVCTNGTSYLPSEVLEVPNLRINYIVELERVYHA